MAVRGGGADLVLANARVLTLDAAQPDADSVVIRRGRIRWVGKRQDLSPAVLSAADVIDCGGQTVVPGFIDAHCHLLAYAAGLIAVDCSPSAVSGIDDILHRIKRRAELTPPGEWIRAAGYSEFDLREKRHPTRWDLDRAAPSHPVRLNHRSGHASILNSLALERAGIGVSTEEPPGRTIARDLGSGEPNGLLLDMDDWLDGRIPPLSESELSDAVADASRCFLSQGVTSIVDATASNSLDRWNLLRRFREDGVFLPSLTVMSGVRYLDDFLGSGLRCGYADGSSTLGHAKMMLTGTSGKLRPVAEELRELVAAAHSRGFPVAIHAVEAEAVIAAAEALETSKVSNLRDRIEHASECPPHALRAMLRARPAVVTQPRFIHDSGARYLSEFGADAEWLYPFRTLTESGIVLAASSDAPVSAPSPLTAIHAAATRKTLTGEVVGESERLTAMRALEMHTINAAYATCEENEMGTITVGKRADLAVLSDDPTVIAPERLSDIRTTMTVLGGSVAWEA